LLFLAPDVNISFSLFAKKRKFMFSRLLASLPFRFPTAARWSYGLQQANGQAFFSFSHFCLFSAIRHNSLYGLQPLPSGRY
jgi:hypothetical protein